MAWKLAGCLGPAQRVLCNHQQHSHAAHLSFHSMMVLSVSCPFFRLFSYFCKDTKQGPRSGGQRADINRHSLGETPVWYHGLAVNPVMGHISLAGRTVTGSAGMYTHSSCFLQPGIPSGTPIFLAHPLNPCGLCVRQNSCRYVHYVTHTHTQKHTQTDREREGERVLSLCVSVRHCTCCSHPPAAPASAACTLPASTLHHRDPA